MIGFAEYKNDNSERGEEFFDQSLALILKVIEEDTMERENYYSIKGRELVDLFEKILIRLIDTKNLDKVINSFWEIGKHFLNYSTVLKHYFELFRKVPVYAAEKGNFKLALELINMINKVSIIQKNDEIDNYTKIMERAASALADLLNQEEKEKIDNNEFVSDNIDQDTENNNPVRNEMSIIGKIIYKLSNAKELESASRDKIEIVRSETIFKIALEMDRQGKYEEALELVFNAIQEEGISSSLFYDIAEWIAKIGTDLEVLEIGEMILRKKEVDISFEKAMVVAIYQIAKKGKVEHASKIIEKIMYNSVKSETYLAIAKSQFETDNYATASEFLKKAFEAAKQLKEYPNIRRAFTNIAEMAIKFLKENDWELILESLERIPELGLQIEKINEFTDSLDIKKIDTIIETVTSSKIEERFKLKIYNSIVNSLSKKPDLIPICLPKLIVKLKGLKNCLKRAIALFLIFYQK